MHVAQRQVPQREEPVYAKGGEQRYENNARVLQILEFDHQRVILYLVVCVVKDHVEYEKRKHAHQNYGNVQELVRAVPFGHVVVHEEAT